MGLLGQLIPTYSIVAVSPAEGLFGIAVQSHFFAVGSIVPWVRPGVGAVATQAIANPDFGPAGLHRLADGDDAATALDHVLATDSAGDLRQVAILSVNAAEPTVATHTGHRCIAYAGHVRDATFSVQANMMDRPGVPEAMAAAYERSDAPFTERLLAALVAAESAGGDIRGMQSAAIVVARITPTGTFGNDRPVDLRVDDAPDPLAELQRLVSLRRGYDAAERGDDALAAGRTDDARVAYAEARERAPAVGELRFWEAIAVAAAGGIDAGRRLLDALEPPDIGMSGRWHRLAARLPVTGLFTLAAPQWDALLSPEPGMIYHVLTEGEVQRHDGTFGIDQIGDEGFIHCSFRYQIEIVVDRHYPGERGLHLAEIDPAAVSATVRVEDSYGIGEAYPHVYGAIPAAAIRRIIRYEN